jgi:prepilin-type N-terminal cleavage/methylation domain-containing protein
MLALKLQPMRVSRMNQAGYTLVELLVAITIMAIIGTSFLVFFKSTFFNYLGLQTDATALTQLDTQANRVALVMRGLTGVTSVAANDIVMYTYFYPSDSYESLVHYYIQTSGTNMQLLADVTPMSGNPPNGTLLTASMKTYTIISSYYQLSGTTLFTYLDANGASLTLPITDLNSIYGVQVNLAAKGSNNSNLATNVQVNIRNRKTNL